jgi:ferrochelatase
MTSAGPGPARGATGVLVMAHGTPSTPAGIGPFYTAIRHGRPPTPELLGELVGRYEAIGGTSPLAERTRAQVEGLARALEAVGSGEFVVRHGAKYASPTIEDGVAALAASGVTRAVGIVLTPHQSALGSGEYFRRANEAAALAPSLLELIPVPSWHRANGFAQVLADRTAATLASLPPGKGISTAVFFTAHSVPERVVTDDDPYANQVHESASDIAALLALDEVPGLSWGVAWQSAGRTTESWIGPDLLLEIQRVAALGATSVVVCPVGFVSDHLEILYDLDIEAAQVARTAGVAFARTASLNDDPRFLGILADVVREAAMTSPDGAPTVTGSTSSA